MTEYVHLIGTEKIANAASEMSRAACVIHQAVGEFGEWVRRFENAVQEDREERAAKAREGK